MRNVQRGASVFAVLAALSLGVTACGGSSASDDSGSAPAGSSAASGGTGGGGSSVNIGFMGALTGPNAQLGINIKQGAEVAINAYNASNPAVKITLKDYDTAGDPAQATSLAPKVASDKVVGVIGPAFSGESKTAVPTLEEAGIPNISASATNATLSANGWKFWHRVLANDDVQGPGVAGFITGPLGAKKVAVIDDQSEYGKGLADVVAKTIGSAASPRDSIDPKADDYSSTVSKIKSANPDAIFYGGYYAEAAKFVKQLRDGGVTAKFVSGDGTLDQKFIDGGKDAAEGAFLSCTCVLATASDDPAVQKFIDDYTKAYGTGPATYSAEGFDAATAFIKALQAGKTSPADINTFLSTEDFKGISKPIKWDDKGELTSGSVYMHEVKDGKIIALGDYKTAKPQ
ncbi:branched-chain amino acid transport system substrate-binding protein [Motilibacter peucedani]|uniref:Branched-chain amino acid transport system substrate-binding protein n=1 Tax=Motilibacter peucedani TaxID=598650 RepID=A0A420XVC1_9ACTN|nr:branched-chain amino acid ABC transporter substrate-binding protein [Motilibacter peucedani]RKS84238.1 branched-chain amino acid transport system substrate-binding protein [Motilibacter peucedani]